VCCSVAVGVAVCDAVGLANGHCDLYLRVCVCVFVCVCARERQKVCRSECCIVAVGVAVCVSVELHGIRLNYKSLLQNIICLIGIFCKRDL